MLIMSTKQLFYHITLAEYFTSKPHFFDGDQQKKPQIRKCTELPFQQTKAKMWDEVTDTLCDLEFIQAKACAKMTYDLVRDFNDVLEVIPENAENLLREKIRQERLEKYTRDLIAYTKGQIAVLEIPDSITPWPQEKIEAEIERMKTNPTKAYKLRDFLNFLGQEAGNLQNFAHIFPHFAIQQAWNYAGGGPVGNSANIGTPEKYKSLLINKDTTRPTWNPYPQVVNILKGHTGAVTAISITADGKYMISGSEDNTCIFWDMKTGKILKILSGHTKSVRSVSLTPDGKRAISGSDDKTGILWDLESGQAIKRFEELPFVIINIIISPDGRHALSRSDDRYAYFWDLETGQYLKIKNVLLVDAIGVSPDGKRAIFVSLGDTWILYDMDAVQPLKTIKGESVRQAVTMTQDRKYIISGIYGGICISDSENGQLLKKLVKEEEWRPNKEFDDQVNVVTVTLDGRFALSGRNSKICILWDLESGLALKTLTGHSDSISALCVTPDAKFAVSGSKDKTCILWDLSTGQAIKSTSGHTDNITTINITPDNKYALSGSADNACILWNLENGQEQLLLKGHTSGIDVIESTPDSKYAVSGSKDTTCKLWDLKTSLALKTIQGHRYPVSAISITPDGTHVISVSDKTCLLWNLENGMVQKILTNPVGWISSLKITPEGRYAISATINGKCYVWDLNTGQIINTLENSAAWVYDIAITPDGEMIVSGSSDHTCFLTNLKSEKVFNIMKGHTERVVLIVITPDGKRAISASDDTTCIIWDLRTSLIFRRLSGHHGKINSISVTPDGKRAVTSSDDNSCIIWDIDTGEKLGVYFSSFLMKKFRLFSFGIVSIEKSNIISIININREMFCPDPGIVTARYIWDLKEQRYYEISVDCPFCGYRFKPKTGITDTIYRIINLYRIDPKDMSYLALPPEAWEESALLSNCPACNEKLKFNPFFAGEENKPKTDWKFWKK